MLTDAARGLACVHRRGVVWKRVTTEHMLGTHSSPHINVLLFSLLCTVSAAGKVSLSGYTPATRIASSVCDGDVAAWCSSTTFYINPAFIAPELFDGSFSLLFRFVFFRVPIVYSVSLFLFLMFEWKWIESGENSTFTSASDVYAFGVFSKENFFLIYFPSPIWN